MNDAIWQFTLRRWREVVLSPRFAAIIAVLSILFAVVVPTHGRDLLARLASWAIEISLASMIAVLVTLAVARLLSRHVASATVRMALGGLAASVPIAIVIDVLEDAFGRTALTVQSVLGLWPTTAMIKTAGTRWPDISGPSPAGGRRAH